MAFISPLPHRGVLRISGDEATGFLQGLISNDMMKLEPGHPLYAALLSPQGRFLHDFILVKSGDSILLDIDRSRLDDLRKRLMLYKLRSKVVIEEVSDQMPIYAAWGDAPPAYDGIKIADPRLPTLGWRLMGAAIEPSATPEGYSAHRIALGVPDSADFIVDRSLLLEMGLEALHGVDFNKGCYVGQEVTARSKFRASLRKQLMQVTAEQELPPLGTLVMAGDKSVGELRTSSGKQGLAILALEGVTAPLMADGMEIAAKLPSWIIN